MPKFWPALISKSVNNVSGNTLLEQDSAPNNIGQPGIITADSSTRNYQYVVTKKSLSGAEESLFSVSKSVAYGTSGLVSLLNSSQPSFTIEAGKVLIVRVYIGGISPAGGTFITDPMPSDKVIPAGNWNFYWYVGQYYESEFGDYTWTFYCGDNTYASRLESPAGAVDVTPPSVNTTDPVNNATNVLIGKTISINYSENIQTGANYANIAISPAVAFTKSIVSNVLTIDPNVDLAFDTLYTITIPIGAVKDMANNATTEQYQFSFTTDKPPTVQSTSPLNNTTDIATSTIITTTFSENISSYINYDSIVLKIGTTPIAHTKSISNNVLTITPSSVLSNSTTYTVEIPASAVKDSAGYALQNLYTFNFTTIAVSDTTPPVVNSTVPSNNATGVSVGQTITITYNENIQSGINYANILINPSVPFVKSLSANTLTIDPTGNLANNTTYTITIPAGAISDTTTTPNTTQTDYSFSFTTQVGDVTGPTVLSTNPSNNVTNIAINTTIAITFDENIQASTNIGNITINSGAVAFTYSISNSILILTPSNTLANNTLYTVNIPASAVKDSFNNDLANLYSFNFTTVAANTGPTIALTEVNATSLHLWTSGNVQIRVQSSDIDTVNTVYYQWTHNSIQPTSGWIQQLINKTDFTASQSTDGTDWHLHIKAVDGLGNISYAYAGPLIKDVVGPLITLLEIGSNPPHLWVNIDIQMRVLASDTSGVGQIFYQWTHTSNQPALSDLNWIEQTSNKTDFIVSQSGTGDWYLHIKALDTLSTPKITYAVSAKLTKQATAAGVISGDVKKSGVLVLNSVVVAIDPVTKNTYNTISTDGYFLFTNVTPGTYLVWAVYEESGVFYIDDPEIYIVT